MNLQNGKKKNQFSNLKKEIENINIIQVVKCQINDGFAEYDHICI